MGPFLLSPKPVPLRGSSLSAGALATLGLLLGACAKAPDPSPAPLDLAPLRTGAPPTDERVLWVTVPAKGEAWSGTAPLVERVSVGEGHGLRLQGGEEHELRVAGSFDCRLFDQAWVEVIAAEDVSLRMGFESPPTDGSTEPQRGGSLDVRFIRAGTRTRVSFDLRNLANEDEPFESLLLLGRGKRPDWTAVSVEFTRRPTAAWLPGLDGPPDLVAVGGDSRRAQGLVGGVPLVDEVWVPEGGRLTFSYAPAPRHPAPQEHTILRVRVGSEEVLRTNPAAGWSSLAWTEVALDLAPFGGREQELLFDLLGEGGDADGSTLVVIAEPALFAPQLDPPTVLLVTTDTHRADHVGAAPGGASTNTPTLDALAREGVLFSNCYATTNITLPSHSALLTGMHPRDTGIINNRTRLAERADTLAERFRREGYATLAVTSAKHMNHPWSGLGQGFDRMAWPAVERDRGAPESIALLERWMAGVEDRPLFVWLHLYDAHRPYEPPPESSEPYYPATRNPRAADLPEPAGPLPPHLEGVRDLDYVRALYRGEVSHMDRALGGLLAGERMARALVAVTGDHGESLGEQGLWWDHVGLYPSVLHVPLILRWPGGPAGVEVAAPVQNSDLGLTLLRLAEVSDEGFPGDDLRLALDPAYAPTPRFAFGSDGHALALTHENWHLVINLDDEDVKPHLTTTRFLEDRPLELFDLSKDPSCEHDLSGDRPERVRQLGARLLRWAEGAGDSLAVTQAADGDALELLAALGYGGGGDAGGRSSVDVELLRRRLAPFLGD